MNKITNRVKVDQKPFFHVLNMLKQIQSADDNNNQKTGVCCSAHEEVPPFKLIL